MVESTILAGELDEDLVRRVYSYGNNLTYANVDKTFYHYDYKGRNTGVQTINYQPWQKELGLSFGSDTIQYEPNIGQKTDIAYYSAWFRAHVDMDYKDIVDIYGIKTYDFMAKGRFYEKSNNGDNVYRNYLYDDSFNATEIFGASVFITSPYFSQFRSSMKGSACKMRDQDGNDVTFQSIDETSIKIEFYSGIPLTSKQTYQINYAFDTYPKAFDSFIYFMPSYIHTVRLVMGEVFADDYFSGIRLKEQTRKLILIVCFAVGGVLFALGISACIIIFIRSIRDEDEEDEENNLEEKLNLSEKGMTKAIN